MYLLSYIHKLFYLEVSPRGFGCDLAIIREIQCKGLYIVYLFMVLQYLVLGGINEYVY